ncbi:DUF4065 domain-containing protein [Bradyrhizobium sp. CCGB01]|nr:DUF4065 domain-containing protein [Bradyrhizobium sp. CCGB01]
MGGRPLFPESIYAWDHGPVIESLYHDYKSNRSQPIPVVTDFDPIMFDHRDREALEDVFEYYGQFSAWKLRNMTHDERPWADAYKRAQGSEIPLQSMIEFFQPQLEADYVKRIYGEALQAKA